MADEPEGLAKQLLGEIREQLAELRDEMTALRDEMRAGFAGVNLRLDRAGHALTLLAGVLHDREKRITRLETTDR